MTPDEEQRRIAAERKRAYRLRKKNEELARQAPKEEQERLFNEQCRNLSPEEIQARIRDDQARMQDSRRIGQATFKPLSKEQQVQAVQQILDSHPELEEQWRNAKADSRIYPMPDTDGRAISPIYPLPDSDGRALPPNMPYQGKKGYHDIVHEALVESVESATPNFRKPPESVSYDDHREQAQAVISEAEERSRRLDLIMANHNRIRSNPSELMWEILKLLNLMRMEMVDLLGGNK